MNEKFDIFNWTPKFDLILKKIENENLKAFNDAMITHEEACYFAMQNNNNIYKIILVKVNEKLPTSIKELIETSWNDYCNS
ncbi:hypothetical protein [Chryseobacterium taihuense]|uniref:Uncharacterized protein n=1 Tax=Chryseobacterium taihuense TaxID=1141221 RepID=A0ABY0R3A4_9FLAO|nr:hypothetical protein [Chryseobacterium taihuense]SDM35334.1 hypothetical protein SAMN05216273_12524 [Chryseobacterium taihuense]